MLPPGYHRQAWRFFCRILQRLEERDVRNGKDYSPPTAGRERKALAEREQQAGARPDALCPTLPTSFDEGAIEKHYAKNSTSQIISSGLWLDRSTNHYR